MEATLTPLRNRPFFTQPISSTPPHHRLRPPSKNRLSRCPQAPLTLLRGGRLHIMLHPTSLCLQLLRYLPRSTPACPHPWPVLPLHSSRLQFLRLLHLRVLSLPRLWSLLRRFLLRRLKVLVPPCHKSSGSGGPKARRFSIWSIPRAPTASTFLVSIVLPQL